jgi:DHA1 family tetracycline resistance protein-like MFS transporter
VLYAGYRYGWGEIEVGLALTLVGALNIGVQGGLVKPFIKRFGERTALITGLFAAAAAHLVYGLAPNATIFIAGIFVFSLIGLSQPALQGLMSKRVSPAEQGQLQGANASIMGLTGILGPILFGSVLAAFIGPYAGLGLPGAPFLLAALITLASAAVATRVTRPETAGIGSRPTIATPDTSDGPVRAPAKEDPSAAYDRR